MIIAMRDALNIVLNIVWLIFGGALLVVVYALAGILAFILIITIPFGVAAFRMANYTLWPFGRTMRRKPDAGAASVIGNVVWFVLFGWWLALGHLVLAIAQFLSIIGIPLGIANIKLIPVSIYPLGHEIVPVIAGPQIPSGPPIAPGR
jgi:uncharacterized membrane protein YccF (DUF307 family)